MLSAGMPPSKAGLHGNPGWLLSGDLGMIWSRVEHSARPRQPSVAPA